MKSLAFFCFSIVCSSHIIFGQTNEISNKRLRSFKAHPYWIDMMQDSSVNYLEAKIAFETFWKNKPSPESIIEGETEEESEERNIFQRMVKSDKKYKSEIIQYAGAHKKFRYWLRENLAYIKPNGLLMNTSEIKALIQQELNNRDIHH